VKARIIFTVVLLVFLFSTCSQSPTPQEFYAKAQTYNEQGKLKAAIISLKNAIQAKPDYLEARLLLGEIYLKSGNGESAEKEFNQAIALSKPSPQLQVNLMQALLLQEKYQAIVDRQIDSSQLKPQQQAELFRIRAESYLKLKMLKSAEKELEQAAALNMPSKELALTDIKLQIARRDVQSAKDNLSKLLGKYPEFADAWYFSSLVSRQQQDLTAAVQDLQKVVDLTDTQLLSRLGFIANIELIELQIGAKNFDQAKQSLEKLQKKTHSRHPVMIYFTAFLDYQDKNYQAAKDQLQQVVQSIPDFMPGFLVLGATQFALQEYESANANVEKYLSAVPKDIGARKLLAEIQLKQNRPIDALESLSSVPESKEKDERFLNLLARATLNSGEAEAATQSLRDLVDSNPSNPRLRAELVQALFKMGEFEEAVKQIEASGVGARQKIIATVAARIRQGKPNIAKNILQAELAINKDAPLLTLAGIVELSDKQSEAANRYFQQALDIDATYTPAMIYLASALIKKKDYENAQQLLEKVIKAQENNWLAILNMATVAAGLKQPQQQVLAWVERANAANPAAIPPAAILVGSALANGEKEKALRLAESLVSVSNHHPKALILLSKVQVALGTTNAAIKTLTDLSKQFPQMADPRRELASIYVKQKNWRSAKPQLEQLLTLNPNDLRARIGLIKVNLSLNDINGARSQAAVVKQGKHHPAITYLISGDIEETAGNWKRAVDFYQQALQARENAETVIKLANAYHQSQRDTLAIALLQKWHDKQSFSLLSLILADYYQRAGDTPSAIKVLQEVSTREPKNPVVWNNLAWMYLQANNEKFVQAAKKAYDINPKSYQIADTYGWMLLQSEQSKEEALSILSEADAMSPGVASIKYHLAVALHKNSRDAEAKLTLEQALSASKEFPERVAAEKLLTNL